MSVNPSIASSPITINHHRTSIDNRSGVRHPGTLPVGAVYSNNRDRCGSYLPPTPQYYDNRGTSGFTQHAVPTFNTSCTSHDNIVPLSFGSYPVVARADPYTPKGNYDFIHPANIVPLNMEGVYKHTSVPTFVQMPYIYDHNGVLLNEDSFKTHEASSSVVGRDSTRVQASGKQVSKQKVEAVKSVSCSVSQGSLRRDDKVVIQPRQAITSRDSRSASGSSRKSSEEPVERPVVLETKVSRVDTRSVSKPTRYLSINRSTAPRSHRSGSHMGESAMSVRGSPLNERERSHICKCGREVECATSNLKPAGEYGNETQCVPAALRNSYIEGTDNR